MYIFYNIAMKLKQAREQWQYEQKSHNFETRQGQVLCPDVKKKKKNEFTFQFIIAQLTKILMSKLQLHHVIMPGSCFIFSP